MKKRSAAIKKRDNSEDSSYSYDPSEAKHKDYKPKKKRKQAKPVGKDKKKVDLDSIKDSLSSESEPSEDHSLNSEESVEASDSEASGSEKHKGKHRRTEEYKEGPKFSKGEVKELILESDFKETLEIRTQPSACKQVLKKIILAFDAVTIRAEGCRKEISKGMTILFKEGVLGKARQVKEIEIELMNGVLSKVMIQTEVYLTKEELDEKSESDNEGDDDEDVVKEVVCELRGEEEVEDEELIKLVETKAKMKAISLQLLIDKIEEWESIQICSSSKEREVKEKLNSEEKAFFCTREFDIKTKKLAPIENDESEDSNSSNESEKPESESEHKKASEEEKPESGNESEESKHEIKKKKKKKSKKHTPKSEQATLEEKQAMLSIYDKACQNLELNAIPDYLPCREKEHAEIFEFIKSGIETNGSATSLYISGMPGTGKTATVLEVIKKLEEEAHRNHIPNFEFIEINGIAIGSIYMVYCKIHKNLTGKQVSPSQAVLFLDKFFKRKKVDMKGVMKPEVVRVILIDELDGLFTKKQDLLYNIFDWPSYSQARLVIIGIANTMNLPEELQGKIASRIGCKRIVYEPYNKEQIQTILNTRISKLQLFEPDAVRYVSMKVAAFSGDMRRCLQISKRSVELARAAYLAASSNEPLKVNIEHLITAGNELFNSKITALIRCLTDYELLMLTALVLERTHAKTDVIKKHRLYDRFEQVINKVKADFLKEKEMEYLIVKLGEFGLVSAEDARWKSLLNETLAVHVFNDELITALEDREEYKVLIELIQDAFQLLTELPGFMELIIYLIMKVLQIYAARMQSELIYNQECNVIINAVLWCNGQHIGL
eukprot:TRINITY_DN59_c0_g2_i1.p1 TRINITY_DN59_c0_g2~~TRINITY_DN59_c0_g2_i1.p1  ORF type:complete len:835 (-),score=142.42 TRINITY_DN59_c0_g2_i1:12692-15196(-)